METRPGKEREAARAFRNFQVWLWSLHLLAAALVGLAFFPAVALVWGAWKLSAAQPAALRLLAVSFSLGLAYFAFGVSLLFLCVGAKNVFGFRIKPGLHPMYTYETLQWMAYNSLVLVANSAFLDVLRISPFQTLFYRLMGAKVGKGVNVNTAGLADLSLLEIGDGVVIGGGTALICHGVERGMVRLAPTKLGARVSIGLNTVIMPDCEIGEGASIAPCSYLPKGTRVPARGVWGGNPVRDLRAERRAALAGEEG